MAERPPAEDHDADVEFSPAPADEVGGPPHEPRVIERVSRPRRIARRASGAGWPASLRWLAISVAMLLLVSLVLAWSALQATERDDAEAVLARAVVPLTELDALLEAEGDRFLTEAAAAAPDDRLTLPHYALPVTLRAGDVAVLDRDGLRAALQEASAALVYDDGIGAFRREAGGGGGLFSARGVMRWSVGRLTADTHDVTWLLLAASLVFTLPALIAVVAFSAPGERLRNVGIAVLGGGLLTVLAALTARFALRIVADGAADPLNVALLDIGADLVAVPLRNGVILTSLGILVTAIAAASRALEPRLAARGAA